ncbi:MAG: hypothetical protein CL916_05120 [Deltaproteobacteria bacterium]|nr:hypothetical protein [Deltaproteobacteria bacterium]
MSSSDAALWQIPFTAHDSNAQLLAKQVLEDQRRTSRHKYWDVECLQESLRKKTFQEILDVLKEDTHPDSLTLYKALNEEFSRLKNWDLKSEPQKFLVLWRDRAFCEGWEDVQQAVDNILFDARWASLLRVSQLQKDDTELGFDPNRIGIIMPSDGSYILDVDQDLVTVWNPHTGAKSSSWSPPSSICCAVPLLDDIIAFGLNNGKLYHWELGEDTQYEVHTLSQAIESLCAQEETCVAFSGEIAHVIDDQGNATHAIPFSTDDIPISFLSPDQTRLILCNREKILVWDLEKNQELLSLVDSTNMDEDTEQMTTAILDMCSTKQGIQLLDAVDLWSLDLNKQFQLLQSLHEPMAISQNCERMVSLEENHLLLLERREGRHFNSIYKESLQNIWGLNHLIALTSDCSVIATAVPEGIIAWDLEERKFSSLPLPFTFTTTLHNIPNSRLIVVDTGQSISIFRFVSL